MTTYSKLPSRLVGEAATEAARGTPFQMPSTSTDLGVPVREA